MFIKPFYELAPYLRTAQAAIHVIVIVVVVVVVIVVMIVTGYSSSCLALSDRRLAICGFSSGFLSSRAALFQSLRLFLPEPVRCSGTDHRRHRDRGLLVVPIVMVVRVFRFLTC